MRDSSGRFARYKTPEERFWSYVDKSGDCWTWLGHVLNTGYGQFRLDNKTMVGAHRAALLLSGVDIEGKVVRHMCHNRVCVRPEHLAVGNHKDNMKDMVVSGRSCGGVKNSSSKLTPKLVRQIRYLYDLGLRSQREIAKAYVVSQATVQRVVSNKGWVHVC